MSTYVRTKRGYVVHRAECTTVGSSPMLWPWADDKDRLTILKAADAYSYRFCSVCRPMDGLA